MRLETQELDIADKVARKVGMAWSAVEIEDLQSHLCLWMLEHYAQVERFRKEEGGGGKLYVSLKREASRYAVKEQEARNGGPLTDNESYSLREVITALPYIFDSSIWPQTTLAQNPQSGAVIHSGSSSDAGLVVALLTDVSRAYRSLPVEQREVLALRFRDDMTFYDIGLYYGISLQAADKRVQRAIKALHVALR